MPMSKNTYVAPTWVDNAPPAISASELQAMCDTIQENQGDVTSLQTALQTLTTTVNGKAKVEVKTYVGTGTDGSSNKISLTFSFPPKMVVVSGGQIGSNNDRYETAIFQNGQTQSDGPGFYRVFITFSGNTVRWYSIYNEYAQANALGDTYYVCAIG